jgi:phage terminase Nu1 subunit (DNA packaging protein)
MLKSAAAKKKRHDSNERKRPTNQHEWRIKNQVKQAPELIKNRIASMELRRAFLEGQNIRNNASEKMRLQGILQQNRVPTLLDGRYRHLHPEEVAALQQRITHLDNNPGNKSYLTHNPVFPEPIIGAQPHYYFA